MNEANEWIIKNRKKTYIVPGSKLDRLPKFIKSLVIFSKYFYHKYIKKITNPTYYPYHYDGVATKHNCSFMNDKTFIKYMNKKNFNLKNEGASEYQHIFFGWLQSLLNIFFVEENLLFNYLSIFKKKINPYKFIKLLLLTFFLIPFSLILTFLEIVQLINPSIIGYYFNKKVS